ncbi:DUF948 domain-containing protein [Virgibacillus necropolis]|uniref:General stress protein n=1 Tax=Virgibacillus necropolis TaxID=163877 RepID=A0A221M7N7_9BACI|nr:DUF948 domain-containing protein [Virgibacillus necropolis]ASN03644.1 general stress protein [Virgibacillus necropolis]
MSLAGLGVLIIGLAFAALALFLVKVLNNLAAVLDGVDKTVEQLPHQIDEVLKETSGLIRHSNDTLADVNEKLRGLSPLFYIIGDVGEASRKLSSSFMDASSSLKNKSTEVEHKYLGSVYGSVALGYYWLRKGKKRKGSESNLYKNGNKRADKIKMIKNNVKSDVNK